MSLFRQVLGDAAFDALPPTVRRVHGATAETTFSGRGVARGSRHPAIAAGRALLGLPQPGRHPVLTVTVAPHGAGETWRRRFGRRGFASRLAVGSSRVDLQACKLEYSIVSPK